MTSEHHYPCVVGISFDEDSTIAIAHVLEPFNIIELLSIKKEEENPYSKLWLMKKRREMLCDATESEIDLMDAISEVFDYGVTFSDFKVYLFNIQTTDEELDMFKEGLTLKKLLTDYLSFIVHIATEKLEVSDEIKKSRYSNDFNEANIRYCFVCPQSFQDYMTECFLDAGIIQEYEVNQRLSFVTEVEAVAYNIISLDRNVTALTPNQRYLICNMSKLAFGIAEINVDTTESLSTVELLYESSDYGSTALQTNFRAYLKENSVELNLNDSIIDGLVTEFVMRFDGHLSDSQLRTGRNYFSYYSDLDEKNPKTNAFSSFLGTNENPITISFDDLNRFVYQPFIIYLTQRIIDSFKSLENRKLILSGKYFYDPDFIDYLLYNSDKTFLECAGMLHDNTTKESFGAVSASMRLKEFQLPFIIDNAVDENEYDNAYETESTNQNFDFVIGIDFGNLFAGCSYTDLRNGKNVIKTIKADDWPSGRWNTLDKIPTLVLSNSNLDTFTAWGRDVHFNAFYDEYTRVYEASKEAVSPFYRTATKEGSLTSFYLMCLNEHVKEFIIENETKGKMKIERYRFRYIMTVPEWWNNYSRNYLVHRAIEAQIIQENEINHLTLITEPDAAMFFSKNLLYNYFGDSGNETRTFILCDAGGFSTNLFTYHCHVQAGELNFYQILESSRNGDGSVSLNENFKDYLESIYIENSDTHGDFEDMVSEETLDYFENVYKPRYMQYLTDDDDGYHDFNLDGSMMLNAMRIPASMEKNILLNDNTTLRIRNEDMKTDIVDPVVNNVLNIIKQQCTLTEDNGMKIEGIIVVGGFSQSKYLQKQIKKKFRGVYNVILPDEPINAISRGAVECALNPSDILRKYRGMSLSLKVQRPLKKYDLVQPSCSKLKGPDGRYYLKNYQQYFVKDGDKIKRNNPPYCFSQLILVEYPKSAIIAIYIRDKGVKQKKLTEIRLDIPPETTGIQNGDMIEYKITVKIFLTEVAVQVSSGNPKTFFDYGTFPSNIITDYFYDHSSYTFLNVIIDDYMVNFGKASPYHIDQLSIGLHDVLPPPKLRVIYDNKIVPL